MGGFKLGKMTLRSLFGKPETVRYPFEEPEHPAALRGKVVFNLDNCIYCGICEKRCPTGAISVNKKDSTWSIDHLSAFNATLAYVNVLKVVFQWMLSWCILPRLKGRNIQKT